MKKNKKMEKLASVVVAGLAVTAVSGVTALAEENGNTDGVSTDTVSTNTDTSTVASAPSTDINKVSQSEPTDNGNGGTTSTITVNPGVSLSEDGSTVKDVDNGKLTSTTTPGESKEETTPSGPPVTNTVENPDGSTTTTTTTPTETTTTENSTTDITGTIKPEGSTEPDEKDKNAVDEEIGNAKNEDGSFDLGKFVENIGKNENYTNVTPGKDENGNNTVTFEQSKTENKPLTSDELGKVLGGVSLTQTGENTYTYTNAAGATVTVTVTGDNSEETDTTTWKVTVTETTTTENGSAEIDKPVVIDPGNGSAAEGELSAKDLLDRAAKGEFTKIETDKDGNIIKIVDGTKTYEFTYKTGDKVEISGMEKEEIFSLLPSDGGFKLNEDGEICDKDGHVLDFGELEGLVANEVEISVTMTDTSQAMDKDGNVDENGVANAEDKAKHDVITDAVNKALKELGKGDSNLSYEQIQKNLTLNDDGTWSYTVKDETTGETTTINGKVALKPVAPDVKPDDGGNVKVEAGADIENGKTVKKEERVEIKDTDNVSFIKDGKVVAEEGKEFGKTGETVKEVGQKDANGNITSVVTTYTDDDGNTVEKTYTFTYTEKVKDNLSKGDYDEMLKGNHNGTVADITGDNFHIKQGTASIIWVKDRGNLSDSEIIAKYASNFPSLKDINNVKVVSGNNIQFDFSGLKGNQSGGTDNIRDQVFTVKDGKLTITGQISHVDMLKQSSIETTLDAAYKAQAVMNFVLGVTGSGSGKYAALVQEGTASGTQYSGSLAYTYEVAGAPNITVEGVRNLERNVDVHLTSDTVTTRPGDPIEDTTTTPGEGGGTTTTPTVTAPDGDVPLADVSDTPVPLAEIPDTPVPLADAPEEISITDEAVPLADIPDETIPLADVPRTGDPAMDTAMAGMAAVISGIILGLRKKRED